MISIVDIVHIFYKLVDLCNLFWVAFDVLTTHLFSNIVEVFA